MKLINAVALAVSIALLSPISASASSFEDLVATLAQHPQVQGILAEGDSYKARGEGALGLPDPMIMLGVDNVPISDPAFDRFLPTSKVIGFNQKIPNPALRAAHSEKYMQMSEKQTIIADYAHARLRFMLIAKLAEYKSVKQQQQLIKEQLVHYKALEDTFEGQIESGGSVYQRFSEVDVERAETERKLNDFHAQEAAIEAEFIRLVGVVPEMDMPEIAEYNWDENPDTLYPVLIAAENISIAGKDIGIADAAFLPNFGLNAIYKQRESGESNSFSGDDWFSLQAQVTVPLWSSDNQKPKLEAAKAHERSAKFIYADTRLAWTTQMTAIASARDAASKNIKVLKDKDSAMKGKISASQRNYEAGTENLDRVLLAKIDRLNILSQLLSVEAQYILRTAEYNSNVVGGFEGTEE